MRRRRGQAFDPNTPTPPVVDQAVSEVPLPILDVSGNPPRVLYELEFHWENDRCYCTARPEADPKIYYPGTTSICYVGSGGTVNDAREDCIKRIHRANVSPPKEQIWL